MYIFLYISYICKYVYIFIYIGIYVRKNDRFERARKGTL